MQTAFYTCAAGCGQRVQPAVNALHTFGTASGRPAN